MDFEHLMQECQQKLGIEHLTPNDDGEYVVEFDGWLEVRLRPLDHAAVLMQSVVGQEPNDDFEARRFLESVLRCGLIHYQQFPEVASIKPETGEVHLYRIVDLDSLTPWSWLETLEEFVNRAEQWTQHLTELQSHQTMPLPMTMLMP